MEGTETGLSVLYVQKDLAFDLLLDAEWWPGRDLESWWLCGHTHGFLFAGCLRGEVIFVCLVFFEGRSFYIS